MGEQERKVVCVKCGTAYFIPLNKKCLNRFCDETKYEYITCKTEDETCNHCTNYGDKREWVCSPELCKSQGHKQWTHFNGAGTRNNDYIS